MTIRKKEKLWEVCLDIYRQMYREAQPSVDFDELREKKITTKKDWFMKYFLLQKRQMEIIKEHTTKNKITNKLQKDKIDFEIHMGCSPNTSEKTWREAPAEE